MAFLSQKVGSVFSLLVLRSLPKDKEMHMGNLSLDHFYRIIAAILMLFYFISGSCFDYLLHKLYVRKTLSLSMF